MMRITVLAPTLLIAAVLIPSSAAAQELAVKGGLNFASFLDDEPRAGNRRGIVIGIAARPARGGRFSLQLEALLSEKGASFEHGDDRIRYLEGPVLGRMDFAPSGAATRPFVLVGVAPAFRLNAHATRTYGTFRLDRIRAFDVGWTAGAGVEAGRALVEARYTTGLRPIDEPDRHDHPERRNRVFSLMAGYIFR